MPDETACPLDHLGSQLSIYKDPAANAPAADAREGQIQDKTIPIIHSKAATTVVMTSQNFQ